MEARLITTRLGAWVSGAPRVVCARKAVTVASQANVTSREWEDALPYDRIPGPKPLPIIGNAWRFVPRIGDLANKGFLDLSRKLMDDFGKIARLSGIPGRKDMVMVYDADDVEKVFRSEGPWPIRGGIPSFEYYRTVTRREFYEGVGGLVTAQGEEWGKFRSSVNQPMMQPRVARNYIAPISEVTDDFVRRMYLVREGNGEMPEDFLNDLYKWGLESITKIALDIRLGCLEDNLAPDSEPQQMIECVNQIFDCLYELNFKVPFWRFISTPTWRRYVKYSDLMVEIVMKYVNLTLERLKTSPVSDGSTLSVLEMILARNPNPAVACVMAIDMMTAGIDTTTNSTAFLWYHLALNPDKQKLLQAEIDKVLSSKQEPITAGNINELRYLKACIKEAMRMSPIITSNSRSTVSDNLVLQGYRIPKGTDVFMNNLIMCGLEKYFPQADKFIPERWLKGHPANEHKPHPFVLLPFGFGPRMCIGRRFADLEIMIATVKVLQNFSMEWHHPPMKVASALINTCASPLRFKMVDRT